MRVLMLVMSNVAGDSRVLREAATLAGAGHEVRVVGKDVPAGWEPPAGVAVRSTSPASVFTGARPRTAGPRRLPPHLRAARWALLPLHRRSVRRSYLSAAAGLVSGERYDVVHAHDFPTLELAAKLAAGWDARLVYDSHECWPGRLRHGRPTPVERWREARTERRLAAGADAVLTVSDGIADRFRRALPEPAGSRVRVVRNTFPAHPPGAGSDAGAAEPGPEPRGVVYAGRVGGGRDLETVLAAAPALAPLRVVVAGPVDEEYLSWLDVAGSGGAVELRPPLAIDDVDGLLRAEGLAVVTLTDRCLNHRLALPNKLFHAVRAGVPVVAADLPELRRVVTEHGLGTLYRPGDPASFTAAVREARDRYPALVAGVRAAAAALSWERDAAQLLDVYAGLGSRGRTQAPAGGA
jgi:glycogen synthase